MRATNTQKRTAERFFMAFEDAIGRRTYGVNRGIKVRAWIDRLVASDVCSDCPASGPVYPLAYLLNEESARVCALELPDDQVSAQIRSVVRALYFAHLLSSNTDLRGWRSVRHSGGYGSEDLRIVADVSLELLQDEHHYRWILSYGQTLCDRWSVQRKKRHKCADYLVFFKTLSIPTL